MDFWAKIYPSFDSNTYAEANPSVNNVKAAIELHNQIAKIQEILEN